MSERFLFLTLVWIGLIFGPKTACSIAIGSQTSLTNDQAHHRSRRSVSSHQVMVTAVPFLTNSYYFNRNELITFKIRMSCNGSGSYTNLKLNITSDWIDLSKGSVNKDMFDTGSITGNAAILGENSLTTDQVIIANVSGVVKDNIEPLTTLELKIELTGDSNVAGQYTSHPTVYGVFPEVNTTGNSAEPKNVYSTINMTMHVKLPVMTTTVLIELTTNIEDYIFMEIQNVVVNKGSAIPKAATPTYFRHDGIESDRVEIDFGNITIADNSQPKDRIITITYTIKINDNENIVNNTKHYFGAGVQVGSRVLWVEQYEVTVLKNEPALVVTATSDQTMNNTRLYIGDGVTISIQLSHHENTSSQTASEIRLGITTDYLTVDQSQTGIAKTKEEAVGNYTYFEFSLTQNEIVIGSTKNYELKMKLKDNVTPLLSVKATIQVKYQNLAGIEKRPLTTDVEDLITATPIIDFQIASGYNTTLSPGQKAKFTLDILLVKMNSPLEVELVMPKGNNEPIMSITDFRIISTGSNLVGVDNSAKFNNRSTTDYPELPDQGVINLGHVKNPLSDVNDDTNKIKMEFTAYLNDFQNVTDGAKFWVGAGVIGRPKMVWVGQIQIEAKVTPNSDPNVAINMTHSGETDTYTYDINFKHSNTSQNIAYNLTFEYYLPPYVKYLRTMTQPSDVTRLDGTRYKWNKRIFYFNDDVQHSIKVELARSKSPKTGVFNFVVPVRVSYQTRDGTWQEFLRAASRSIEVLPNGPTIPKDSRAKIHYYGRGFYWSRQAGNDFYVCMNQHVPTATPACYQLHSDGQHFIALDRRIGCILGHSSDSKLYGLARNQITAMVFDDNSNDWFPIPDNELPNKNEFTYKDLTGTTSVGPLPSPSADHHDTLNNNIWQGTGDGLYYKENGTQDWKLKAKWFV